MVKTTQVNHEVRCFKGHNGLDLFADCYGDPTNQAVLFAHGGGQTRYAWGQAAKVMGEKGFYGVAFDSRGHGDSEWCPEGDYRLADYGNDIGNIAKLLNNPIAVGASLGGLSAISATHEVSPDIFEAIILVDITPRMKPDGVAKVLGFMSEKAEQGFASLEEASDAIALYLPHRKKPKSLDGLAKNLRLGDDGRYRWHWDPKFVSSDNRPTMDGHADRLYGIASKIQQPMLLIRGQMSELVTEDAVEEFLERIPNAQYVDIKDAGHMIAGDKNDVFTESVVTFVNSLELTH